MDTKLLGHQIVAMSDSRSDSDTDEKAKKYVSKLQLRKNSKLRDTAEGISDKDSDTENIYDAAKHTLPKRICLKNEKVSLRIKLRRSTNQSLYKIDTDSEYESSTRKSRNIKNRALRQRKKSCSEVESEGSYTDHTGYSENIQGSYEKEQAENSDESDIFSRPRIRRQPLRFSSYHCRVLPSLNHSTNSPPSLRNRQSINYNEDKLLARSLVSNVKALKKSEKQKENKVSSPIVKNNKRNRIPSVKYIEKNSSTEPKAINAKSLRKSANVESNDKNKLLHSSKAKETTKEYDSQTTIRNATPGKVDNQKRTNLESMHQLDDNNCKDSSDGECLTDMYKRIKISSTENATPRKAKKQKNCTPERTPRNKKLVHNNSTDDEEESLADMYKSIEISSAKKAVLTTQRKSNMHRKIELQMEEAFLSTPKSRSVKYSSLTPSMGKRSSALLKPITPLQEARSRLHVSAVPKSLPCREEEFNNIFTFLKRKLEDKSGGCIYISGVPGTGKTATVNEAVRCLQKLIIKGQLDDFDYVAINGMKLTEPRQSYVQILKQLNGKTVTWEQAYHILESRFHNANSKMTLLLVDELDFLCTKRQDVVYNLLDWPTKATAQLVVITIANTMDLPERVLMGRVTSRLGLTRLTFQPYNYKQLQEIVMSRLKDFNNFRSEAVQLVARKVSAVSGDARRALDICRRAMEIAELKNAETISLQDVTEAVSEMIASAKVQAIKHCSKMEQIFMQAVAAEVIRTSIEEVYFKDAYNQIQSLCSFDGIKLPTITEVLGICGRLGASRLLICDHSRKDIYQKILLNVSTDDIHYATQELNLNAEQ